MAIVVFIGILVLSLVIALFARKGAIGSSMDDVMVASGSFGAFLMFFVAVGEIYSIGTMIGVPGAVYSKGTNYALWFIAYILLAYCVGYFLNPAIWRMGQICKAVSIGDVIGWRFNSKWLQVIVALVAIFFLAPWTQNQFAGMAILFNYLDIGVGYTTCIIISAALAFIYIAVAGIRAPAWVSVLKDILLLAGIIVAGIVAATKFPGGVHGIFSTVAAKAPEMLVVKAHPVTENVTFLLSTILFQMLGFYMLPMSFQAILTGKSEKIIRRNQIIMPLYMIMFPFLIITAYFALITIPGLAKPDEALLAVVTQNLPGWVVGMIAGGGALTAILVMAMTALTVGGMFSKNILGVMKPDMQESQMVWWTRAATGIFLFFSVMLTLYFPQLMAGVITLAYSGLTQTFGAVFFGFFWKKATKMGIGAGIIAGVASIFLITTAPWGLNKGFVALFINIVVTVVVSLMTKADDETVRRFELFKTVTRKTNGRLVAGEINSVLKEQNAAGEQPA
ncbi:MAG TPA: symporter [Syntrophomonas sp.]|jgi:SSS family solute:Na+ symporter|nr:symporter [Syntrophomonas sp.]HCF70096.1 symporter [Syntrophomonas sp.]